jgi:hypothetical protein
MDTRLLESTAFNEEPSTEEKSVYPQLPFPPSLISILTKLSKGFNELKLKCKLRESVIKLLKDITETRDNFSQQANGLRRASYVPQCKHLLIFNDSNNIEKLACTTSMAYAITSASSMCRANPEFALYRHR